MFVVIAVMSGMPHACPGAALPSSNADIDPTTANALSQASSIAARLPPESVLLSSSSGSICRPQMPPVELMYAAAARAAWWADWKSPGWTPLMSASVATVTLLAVTPVSVRLRRVGTRPRTSPAPLPSVLGPSSDPPSAARPGRSGRPRARLGACARDGPPLVRAGCRSRSAASCRPTRSATGGSSRSSSESREPQAVAIRARGRRGRRCATRRASYAGSATTLVSRYSSNPAIPISRPTPDCL